MYPTNIRVPIEVYSRIAKLTYPKLEEVVHMLLCVLYPISSLLELRPSLHLVRKQ